LLKPDIAKELLERMEVMVNFVTSKSKILAKDTQLNQKIIERLRALGYLK